ncbi:hypothetical protein FB567DRAFT_598955 [Paraphoma chrysanthemicola]|uniref:Uncharacterized protein n=1 Tax=Paraphoma chrysanthemicola TaxID=798071 RepID=A0A8K0VSL6_9PLEO|nr:hypothetical protein FB567DRAFT_598955 [Paraphoma chrysanthemicola]
MSQPEITYNTRQPITLLGLPAEIRNLIYNFTFDTCTVYVPTSRANLHRRGKIRPGPGLGLAYANRQTHTETALITYKHITFAFTNTNRITQFLRKRSQDQIHVIRNLQLSVLYGYRLFGDGRDVFSADTVGFIQRFPSLQRVVLIEMSGHKAYVVLGQLKRLASMIRKWKAEVEIEVRDTDDKWAEML